MCLFIVQRIAARQFVRWNCSHNHQTLFWIRAMSRYRIHRSTPQRQPSSPLPNMCYKVMKTPEIKKLLQKYSLPTIGTREQLIERHRQFTLRVSLNQMGKEQYNAELDTSNPLPVWKIAQIVLSNEERSKRSWVVCLSNWSIVLIPFQFLHFQRMEKMTSHSWSGKCTNEPSGPYSTLSKGFPEDPRHHCSHVTITSYSNSKFSLS